MKKVGTKLILLAVCSIVVTALTSVIIMYFGNKQVVNSVLGEETLAAVRVLGSKAEEYQHSAQETAGILAQQESMIDAVRKQNKQDAAKELERHLSAAQDTGILAIVTDEKGKILARSFDSTAGDSAAELVTVSEALKGKSATALERGAGIKLAAGAGAPVKDASGNVAGAVFVAYNLEDPALLDGLKSMVTTEYTVFLGDERINTTIQKDGERQVGTKLSARIADIVLKQGKPYTGTADILGASYYTAYEPIKDSSGTPIGIFFAGKPISTTQDQQVRIMLIADFLVLLIVIVMLLVTRVATKKFVTNAVGKMSVLAREMAAGNLSVQIAHASKDELGQLSNALGEMVRTLREYVHDIDNHLSRMAQGDMTEEITQEYIGEFAPIKEALVRISESLNETLSAIGTSSEQVSSGAEQVAAGAQALSQGATEQASAIEQLSSSIVEVGEKVRQNAEHVKTATDYVGGAAEGVGESNERMQEMLAAMRDISTTSGEIGKIIKVIDDIAFQTNILALNAAVEAARAGTAGKGFAVVADEVRNLASKSADAAKHTTELIERSVAAVQNGSKIAEDTAGVLSQVSEKAGLANEAILLIERASGEQAAAIDQISQGIEQISAVIQTNAATAEEGAAASEELSGQAAMLRQEVSKFKLRGGPQKGEN